VGLSSVFESLVKLMGSSPGANCAKAASGVKRHIARQSEEIFKWFFMMIYL
jgi:hypothetical protein